MHRPRRTRPDPAYPKGIGRTSTSHNFGIARGKSPSSTSTPRAGNGGWNRTDPGGGPGGTPRAPGGTGKLSFNSARARRARRSSIPAAPARSPPVRVTDISPAGGIRTEPGVVGSRRVGLPAVTVSAGGRNGYRPGTPRSHVTLDGRTEKGSG